MSEKYQPKVGDRVRVVLEGEVSYVDKRGEFAMTSGEGDSYFSNVISAKAEHTVSVEKVAPPLPTTPGSVVCHDEGSRRQYYALQPEGRWSPGWLTPFELLGMGAEVIFDAGAAK